MEVDVDTTAYDQGHVPGAVGWNWTTQLCDTLVRDIVPTKQARRAPRQQRASTTRPTIVLYGDNNNWFAAWAFWQLKIYGHQDVRLMDGGRKKWLAEGTRAEHRRADARGEDLQGAKRRTCRSARSCRKCSRRVAGRRAPRSSTCAAPQSSPARSSRRPACRRPASAAATSPARRTSRGRKTATTTARSRAADDLKTLYDGKGVTGDKPMIAYCRIGERSSHLVRAEVPARLRQREELRRLLDRVGQPGRRAGREAVTSRAADHETEDYTEHQEEIAGWQVKIVTYKIGGVYHCTIDNVDPGARFARAESATREEAEHLALEKARKYLAQTRKFPTNPR